MFRLISFFLRFILYTNNQRSYCLRHIMFGQSLIEMAIDTNVLQEVLASCLK